jgi:hypothetical protein
MKLYVPTMEAFVVEIREDCSVRLDGEDWSTPTLQERRHHLRGPRGARR